MQPAKFLVELRQILPPATSARVLSALRHDRLVWSALQEPAFMRLVLTRVGEAAEDWSPANLCLLAVEEESQAHDLSVEPLPAIDPEIRKSGLELLEEVLRTARAPRTLAEAGLLALALRERRRRIGSWKGLLNELLPKPGVSNQSSFKIWQTPLACLYGLTPDPVDFLKALKPVNLLQPSVNWINHTIFSNPLDTEAQSHTFMELMVKLPLGWQVEWLRHLAQTGHLRLAQSLAKALIQAGHSQLEAIDLSADRSLMNWHELVQHSATCQLTAGLMQLAGDGERANLYLEASETGLRHWLHGIRLMQADQAIDEAQAANHLNTALENTLAGSSIESEAALISSGLMGADINFQENAGPFGQLINARRLFRAGDAEGAKELASAAVDEILGSMANQASGANSQFLFNAQPVAIVNLLLEIGLPVHAAQIGEQYITQRPGDLGMLSALVSANRAAGRTARALNCAYEALLLDPQSTNRYRTAAELWETIGQWERGLAERRNLLLIDTDAPVDDRMALALAALHSGEAQEALTTCQAVLAGQPEHGLALAYLGLAQADLGHHKKAIKTLQEATMVAADQPLPWINLGEVYSRQGDYDRAAETLRAGSLANPGSGEIQYALGSLFLRQGLATEALPYLRKASDFDPRSIPLTLTLGRALRQQGHHQEALDLIIRARSMWEKEPQLAFLHGELLLDDERVIEGVAALEDALEAEHPQNEWLMLYAETLLKEFRKQTNRPMVEQDFSLLNRAQQAIQRALNDDKELFEARLLMAEAQLLKGNMESAFNRFSQLLEVDLPEAESLLWRVQMGVGESALRLERLETALAAFQSAAQVKPDSVEIQRMMANAYHSANLIDEACRAAENAVQIEPNNLDTLIWYGNLMQSLNRLEDAKEAFRRAVNADVDRADLIVRLADIYLQAGEMENAGEMLSAVQHMANSTVGDLRQAAYGFLALGQERAALDCLERAQGMSSQPDLQLLFESACLLQRLGQTEPALEKIQQAISLDTQSITLYLAQADLLATLGRSALALVSLEHALQQQGRTDGTSLLAWLPPAAASLIPPAWQMGDQSHLDLQIRFIMLLENSGRLGQALEQAEQAIAICPFNLTLRFMAAELCTALGLEERAARLLDLPDLNSDNSSVRFDVCGAGNAHEQAAVLRAFQAELALAKQDATEARHRIDEGQQHDPKNLRLLAAAVRLCNLEGDIQGAEGQFETLQAGLTARGDEDKGDNILQHRTWLNPERGSWFAEAALAAGSWNIGIELYAKLTERYPLDMGIQAGCAWAFVRRAEAQALCEDLYCELHSPGAVALDEESYRRFGAALSQAAAICPPEVINLIKRRGEAVFAPNTETAIGLDLHGDTPQGAAAVIMAYRRADLDTNLTPYVEVFSNDAIVLAQVAITAIKQNKPDDFVYAQKAVERAPRNPLWHALFAMAAEAAGEVRYALESLEIALDLWPEEPAWHGMAARLAETAGESSNAVRHWEVAYEKSPEDSKTAFHLGKVYLAAKNFPRAIETLRLVAEKQPENVDAWVTLASALKSAGRLEEALEATREAGALDGDQPGALTLAGEIYLAMGEPMHAMEMAESARKLDDRYEPSILLQSRALVQMDEPQKALQVLEKALGVTPEAEILQVEYARLVRQRDGSAKSRPLIELLAKHFPVNDGLLSLLALTQADCGDATAAEATASAALRLNPSLPDLHLLLGNLNRKAGQLDQALHYYSQAVELNPDSIDGYIEMGKLYHQRREDEDAMVVFQQAMKLAPQDHRPYYHAALAMRDGKDYRKAEELLRKAADLAPNDTNIRRQLAAVIALNLVHHSQETHS